MWNDLKAAVAAVIKTNGTQAITGALLQSTLNSIIDQVGGDSTFKGVAIPSTNPGSPDGPTFYIASTPGTYSNFGGFVLNAISIAVISNRTGSWVGSIIISNLVNTESVQTINSLKTFSISPIIPVADGDNRAQNKAGVEAQITGRQEAGRSQSATKSPTSKLMDDELLTKLEQISTTLIDLIRLHNPNLVFKGFATQTTTLTVATNNAFVILEDGAYKGITGCKKGQIIYCSFNSPETWGVEWPSNRANKYDMLGAYSYIFNEFKGTPVDVSSSVYNSFAITYSTFNGWRTKYNFTSPFRVISTVFASSEINEKVIGYIWDENGKIVSTASVTTKTSGTSNFYWYDFIFDKEITTNLVGSKFWFGFKAEKFTGVNVASPGGVNVTGGLIDTTTVEQYSVFSFGIDLWVNVSSPGSKYLYIKLFNNNSIISLNSKISDVVNDILLSEKIRGVSNSFKDTIKYSSITTVLNWTTINSGNSYGSPFVGWGALYTKSGISFNAVKIPPIYRTSVSAGKEWFAIQVFVKNSQTSTSIIAKSPKIYIDDPTVTILPSILLPLMDETLTNFVTLNDASFSGSTYFIGYILYDKNGSYAYGGTNSGSQSNYAGSSFYLTDSYFNATNPITWATWSGNPCLPMQHILLTEQYFYKYLLDLIPIETRLTSVEGQLGTGNIEISLPDKIYAVVGDKLQLFFRGMIKAVNPYNYNILVTCSNGNQYPRYFEYTPTSPDVGTTTFKVEVKDNNGIIKVTKTCSLITKAVVQSPSTTKKILCVGDSLTSSGIWCIEASRRLIGTGGTPAGLALSNISFLGRKTGSGIGWEGNGGWTWDSYATAGRSAYKFYLSGVITAPGIGSTYTNNGITYTVSEVNLTGGTGYISAEGSGAPTSSGTLTKASGTGDATLVFSSYSADSGNPFWEADTNSLDFPQYVNTYMGGACDAIYFLLTWNGQTPWRTNFASMIATAKTLIDHIHTHYPNCKMKIMGIQIPSLNGGMGVNYGATGTSYADTYGNVVTVLNMNKAYQDWCNESAYSSFLEFVNVSAQFDSENNMPETDKVVNTRSVKTEKIGTNGVHPSTGGYYQIGDVVFRNFIANFCQ